MITLLAQWVNAHAYDNGQDLRDLLQAQGQNNWLVALAVGCVMFVAFSSRFKP